MEVVPSCNSSVGSTELCFILKISWLNIFWKYCIIIFCFFTFTVYINVSKNPKKCFLINTKLT